MARLKRTHIVLPEDLAHEIDAIAGRRGRSAFLVKTAAEAVRRAKLLQILESGTPVWKNEDHPELAEGSGSWVRKLRKESEREQGKSRRRKKR